MRGRWTSFLALAALAGLFGLTDARGQSSRGTMRGDVVDTEGAPLPGVQITVSSPALIQPRSVVSGPNGEFNVPSLPVGTYTVEATLASFAPAKQEGIRVLLGGTATVKLTMHLESMQVTTEVVGEAAPVIDPTDTGTGGRVTYEELIKVPTARDPWAVLALVPGMQVDRVNVGGTQSGQQANFVAKGSPTAQSVWTIDGVNITDAAALGSSPVYYDFGAIEEVQVTTGGNDASQLTAGVGINIVTKRGSNDFHGSGRTFFTNDKLQNENISDALHAAYPTFVSPKVDQILEFGGEVGGPVVKDRLWFWGSGNRNDIKQITVINTEDHTTLLNFAGKLSGQITDQNEANAFFQSSKKEKIGRDASPTRLPDSTFNQGGTTPILKVEDQQIFGSDTLFAGKFAYVGGGFFLHPQGSVVEGGAGRQSILDANSGIFDRNYVQYDINRPQYQYSLDGSHFHTIGSLDNDFKFGFSYRHTPNDTVTHWDGGGLVIYNRQEAFGTTDVADTAIQITPDVKDTFISNTASAYVTDTITKGNLTADLGLRYDRQVATNGPSFRDASALDPTFVRVEITSTNDVATWNLISPRVGLSYQLGEKTLIKANYALYADQIAASLALDLNPVGYAYSYGYFHDLNGDLQAQPNEVYAIAFYDGIDPAHPAALTSINEVDPNLSSPKTNEVVLGLTRQLGKDTSVGVNFTYRRRNNDIWTVPFVIDSTGNRRLLTLNDWVPASNVTGAGNPNGDFQGNFVLGPYSIPAFTLAPGLALDSGATLRTNRDDYYQQFVGGEFIFQKRFSDQWSFAANFSVNSWTEHFTPGGPGDYPVPNRTVTNPGVDGGAVAPQSAGSGAFANVFENSNWTANVRGSYTIPNIDVDLGANITARQGYPSPFTHSKSLSTPGGSSSYSLLIGELDSTRMANLFDIDLHLGKEFKFTDSVGLELAADMFNVLNSDLVLQHQRSASSASTFLRPTELLGPRLLRVSARLKF
jgi:carboxypeptidase family protein/TonB-dependent receptor-like protein